MKIAILLFSSLMVVFSLNVEAQTKACAEFFESVVPETYGNTKLYEQIHEDALLLLESVGLGVSPEAAGKILQSIARERFGKIVFSPNVGRIYIPRETVSESLRLVRKGSAYFPKGFGPGGEAAYVLDEKGNPRDPTIEDLIKVSKIVARNEEFSFMSPVFRLSNKIRRRDTKALAKCEIEELETSIKHSGGKLVSVQIVTDAAIDRAAELYRKGHKIKASVSLTEPFLTISDDMVGPVVELARKGVPMNFNAMPIAGFTGPYSLSALVTLAHAEALAAMAIAQLIHPGIKVVNGALPTVADLGSEDLPMRLGSDANSLANILTFELNRHLGVPSSQSMGSTNHRHPGSSSREEAARAYALLTKYGFHEMRHLFGFSDQLVDFSTREFVDGIELYRAIAADPLPYLEEPPEVATYDPDGLECLIEGIVGRDFKNHPLTLRNQGKTFLK